MQNARRNGKLFSTPSLALRASGVAGKTLALTETSQAIIAAVLARCSKGPGVARKWERDDGETHLSGGDVGGLAGVSRLLAQHLRASWILSAGASGRVYAAVLCAVRVPTGGRLCPRYPKLERAGGCAGSGYLPAGMRACSALMPITFPM